jgi:hypothetical protein
MTHDLVVELMDVLLKRRPGIPSSVFSCTFLLYKSFKD